MYDENPMNQNLNKEQATNQQATNQQATNQQATNQQVVNQQMQDVANNSAMARQANPYLQPQQENYQGGSYQSSAAQNPYAGMPNGSGMNQRNAAGTSGYGSYGAPNQAPNSTMYSTGSQNGAYQPGRNPYSNTAYGYQTQQGQTYQGDVAGSRPNYQHAAFTNASHSGNTMNQADPKTVKAGKKKEKKPKQKGQTNPVLRRVGMTAVCGLVFGLIAGLGFFAVKEIGTVVNPQTTTESYAQSADSSDISSTTPVTTNKEVADAGTVKDSASVVQANSSATAVVTDVTEVVEEVMPSIVSVINSYTSNYYYFSEEEEASGSGIIIGSNDTELLLVTNYHVVENNDSLKVTFCDNTEAIAQVKGQDKEMDLAVIAVKLSDLSEDTKKNISIATMGDSDNLKVGEPAIAIGNALGYGQSVTTGVISAVNREMDMNGVKGTFIQTDAAINPGNSGGALLNIAGEVVGINSNKLGGSAVEGMGYAIPITAAKPILEDLMIKETKQLAADDKQAYLGISGANITTQEKEFYGYPDGIYVANVYEDTAAEAAGIQKGDFLVSFDGETVSTMEELQKLLLYYEAGTQVDVVIYRYTPAGYEEQTVQVTLGNRQDIKN